MEPWGNSGGSHDQFKIKTRKAARDGQAMLTCYLETQLNITQRSSQRVCSCFACEDWLISLLSFAFAFAAASSSSSAPLLLRWHSVCQANGMAGSTKQYQAQKIVPCVENWRSWTNPDSKASLERNHESIGQFAHVRSKKTKLATSIWHWFFWSDTLAGRSGETNKARLSI